jgi:hypothetical protein
MVQSAAADDPSSGRSPAVDPPLSESSELQARAIKNTMSPANRTA